MSGREKFRRARNILIFLERLIKIIPLRVREKLFVHYRGAKGKKGIAIRYILLKTLAKKIGDNVCIQPDVYLLNVSDLEIGCNVSIHPLTYIDAKGGVSIGDNVSIAEGTSIISFDHGYADNNVPMKYQKIIKKPITICNDVWLGAKSTILGDVTIAEGSIVGAGAVVTKSTHAYSIVGGVPAKQIGDRMNKNEK